MSFDLRRIAEAQKKSVAFVENAEQRRILEQFVESAGALVEAAARDALQELADEINSQLAPGARVRLVQEGSKVVQRSSLLAMIREGHERWLSTVKLSQRSWCGCRRTLKPWRPTRRKRREPL